MRKNARFTHDRMNFHHDVSRKRFITHGAMENSSVLANELTETLLLKFKELSLESKTSRQEEVHQLYADGKGHIQPIGVREEKGA